MPSATTELFGNQSYRGLYISRVSTGTAGVRVGLIVGCENPSNTAGAALQLQYANYSDVTHTNSSVFVFLSASVLIDNSANNPCPGMLESSNFPLQTLNTNPAIFIFRVIGNGGGGAGDNPRFNKVQVYVTQRFNIFFDLAVSARSTTSFTAVAIVIGPLLATSTIVNFGWIATNNFVLGQSGESSCTIPSGIVGCSIVITFSTTFATVPDVTLTPRNTGSSADVSVSQITLFITQVSTV
jgi:hypothetical protein